MNNKILISLFCSILLVFVLQGVNLFYKINYIFENIQATEFGKIKDFNGLFVELNNFENFLYYTGSLIIAIVLPVFIKKNKQKTKNQVRENLEKIKRRAVYEKLI